MGLHTYLLPCIVNLGRLVVEGTGAYIWAIDVSRDYHQFRVDPLSCPLHCIASEGRTYIDLTLLFGCCSSGALTWILRQRGHHVLSVCG